MRGASQVHLGGHLDGADFIGPFEIRGKLGRGAMAVVWRGYDPSLDREVAIKEPVLPEDSSDELRAEFAQRFVREARAAARLDHPGIVTIYSAAVYDGRPVIVMKLIEGLTLRSILRQGRLTTGQTFALLEQLLEAVGYAHAHGVTHRDLKPDNVFVTRDGAVKLADFGIARLSAQGTMDAAGDSAGPDDSALTQAGQLLGTPAYMSPERIRGEAVDARCDVFSLGVIAYECLAGANPFGNESKTHHATIIHRIMSEPTPPLVVDDAVAGPLADVIMEALEKNRDDRFQSAGAMVAAWRAAFPRPIDTYAELAELCGAVLAHAAAPATSPAESTEIWGPAFASANAPVTTAQGADDEWHSSDVVLDLRSEGGEAAADIQYRVDGGPWTTGHSVVISARPGGGNDGEHVVTFRAVDATGIAEAPHDVHVRIDTLPPHTVVHGHREGWQTADVTLQFEASDTTSGVAATEYRIDDEQWTTGRSVTLKAGRDGSNDGRHTVAYRSRDVAGNVEEERSVTVAIDARAPVTRVSGADDLWHAQDVHLTLGAQDGQSGVVSTEYRIDDAAWIEGVTPIVRAWPGGGNDGEHIVRYRSTDGAGNVEAEQTALARIDTTPPATTVEGNDDARRGGRVKLRLAATDPHSGVARTEYRIDGGEWRQGTTVTLPESPVGVHTVEYRSVDGAGNVETTHKAVVETRGEEGSPIPVTPSPRRPRAARLLLIVLAIIIGLAAVAGIAALALREKPPQLVEVATPTPTPTPPVSPTSTPTPSESATPTESPTIPPADTTVAIKWSNQYASVAEEAACLNDVTFIDKNRGWAVGYSKSAGSTTAVILCTNNGGSDWMPADMIQVYRGARLRSVDFVDGENGWAVGYTEDNTGQRGEPVIRLTKDGGLTWELPVTIEADSGTTLSSVDFADGQRGWAVGFTKSHDAIILATTNGGLDWTVSQTMGRNMFLYSVYFLDAKRGWAVGENVADNQRSPLILFTTNGGVDWQYAMGQYPGDGGALNSVYFVDDQHGWAVGSKYASINRPSGPLILATDDGGESWLPQNADSDASTTLLQSVGFTDGAHGWAVGYKVHGSSADGAAILATSDGVNWRMQDLSMVTAGQALWGASFFDAEHGCAVGARSYHGNDPTGAVILTAAP